MYTIKPLFHGVFLEYEQSNFTYKTNPGTKLTVPLVSFLVEGNGKKILVDSGPPSPELMALTTYRKVYQATYMQDELQKQGLTPEDIDMIILTHLHWDHCYNLELFPDKPIYIQRAELVYSLDALPMDAPFYKDYRGNLIWGEYFNRIRLIDGDFQLMDGINLMLLPGHSNGIQCVLVNTEEGRYLIASDTYPMYENYEKSIPSGIHVNLNDWYESHRRALAVADHILPGHDMQVLDREVYGKK